MSYSFFGQVVGFRQFVNGDIEIDFYHEDEITEFRYSSNSDSASNFPKDLAETLGSTLATNICVEVFFDEKHNPTHIELEECDDDSDDDEDDSIV